MAAKKTTTDGGKPAPRMEAKGAAKPKAAPKAKAKGKT
jgi:hypothetical protein